MRDIPLQPPAQDRSLSGWQWEIVAAPLSQVGDLQAAAYQVYVRAAAKLQDHDPLHPRSNRPLEV